MHKCSTTTRWKIYELPITVFEETAKTVLTLVSLWKLMPLKQVLDLLL